MKLLTVTICVAAIGCAEVRTTASSQESRGSFFGMVLDELGAGTTWDLRRYGCHCGLGSPDGVKPVDLLDTCCWRHDVAWLFAWYQVDESCDCREQQYQHSAALGCTDPEGTCARYCCDTDTEFIECARGAIVDPALTSHDRATCEPEGATCCQFFPEGGMTTMSPSECLGYGGVDQGPSEDCFGGELPPGIPTRDAEAQVVN